MCCPPASGPVFLGPSVGRALRLTWGAACSAQQPRASSLKPPITALKPSFPHRGNILSIVWKNVEKFFHCVEKSLKVFPLRGKIGQIFSIVWKNQQILFHSVENHAPACRKYFLRKPHRRSRMSAGWAGRPLWPQNAFSAAPIFSLASRPGFCDKFGSSEMLCVRTCSFYFAF